MASGFFILMRFFLRVDGVLVRMNDTRIYHQVGEAKHAVCVCACFTPRLDPTICWVCVCVRVLPPGWIRPFAECVCVCVFYPQAGSDHLLREFTSKEAKISELKVHIQQCMDFWFSDFISPFARPRLLYSLIQVNWTTSSLSRNWLCTNCYCQELVNERYCIIIRAGNRLRFWYRLSSSLYQLINRLIRGSN